MFESKRKNLVYLLIILIPFFIFFVRSEPFSQLKFNIVRITAKPLEVVSFPFREIKKMLYYHRTFDEYRRLKKRADTLEARLVGLDEVIRENNRLEKLLEFRRRLIYPSVSARIIGRDPSLWNSSVVIDKGTADGIKPGMPVVNSAGVIGKIAEASDSTAKVLLISDPQFSVAVMVKRSRESALVSGSLQGICRLRYLNSDADVRIGDKVITSKLSSSFPESLIVGDIVEIEDGGEEAGLEAVVQPAVTLSQIEEVLVITVEEDI